MTYLAVFVFSILMQSSAADEVEPSGEMYQEFVGRWSVSLNTLGENLDFQLDVDIQQPGLRAVLINGPERIAVDAVVTEENKLLISMPYFDSQVLLAASEDGLVGSWRKRRAANEIAVVPCSATRFETIRCNDPQDFLGRWSVQFADSQDPAVGIFQRFGERRVLGTFLTTTGDYRYLSGQVVDDTLTLSCFDGAHAFLFKAKLDDSQGLSGEFYSGNWHHESWTAARDPRAALPDAFQQTKITDGRKLKQLRFPDLEGRQRSLEDPSLMGRVTLIELFGSWCPNCHDEARYLAELRAKYASRGLKVLGLAFELTGDFKRDAEQVRRYRARFGVDYPILIAGTSDKAAAAERFPVLDRVRSFPTTLFVDQSGEIRAVYTGYSGPATGDAHLELCERFESLIESLLDE